ncbi:MAG: glycosyltransferase family 2 protein [Phycisphaerae bacterium]
MRLQVVIFALNEEPTIEAVVRGVPGEIEGVDEIAVTLIDDGFTDRTAELARAAGAPVVSHGRNRGLGWAFQTGVREALEHDADIMVTVDGDGQFDARQIPDLIGPILAGKADMTTCSRFIDSEPTPRMPRIRVLGNAWVASLVSSLTRQRFFDVSCGYRAYNRECLITLNLMGRFTHTHEAIMEVTFKGLRVEEVPLPVQGVRSYGKSRIAPNVVSYGWRTLRIMLGTLLNHRPHHLFGVAALLSLALAVLLSVLGSLTWFTKGTFIKAFMLTGGFFLGLSVVLALFGLQARAIRRNQFLLESLLYELRARTRTWPRRAMTINKAESEARRGPRGPTSSGTPASPRAARDRRSRAKRRS